MTASVTTTKRPDAKTAKRPVVKAPKRSELKAMLAAAASQPISAKSSKRLLADATFFTTVNELAMLPQQVEAEIAFAGRSNAGKSSAINTLANRNRLAFTSKTPGRTQHLNYFGFAPNRYVVDLPGYGYAKVPHAMRAHWERFLAQYLTGREPLMGLVLIMDIRHALRDLDWAMLDWFAQTKKPVHCLLTKVDKLNRAEGQRALNAARKALAGYCAENALPEGIYTAGVFSSLNKTGIEEVESVLRGWLAHVPAFSDRVSGDGGASDAQ
jgi:GTP-binding protein